MGSTITQYKPRDLNTVIWNLSYPTLVSLMMHNGFGVFEATLISYFSTENLTVLSFGFPIVLIFTNSAMGLGIGVNSLTARLVGREQWGHDSKKTCLLFALLSGVAITGLTFLLVPPVLQGLGTPQPLFESTMAYLEPILWGGPIYFLFTAACGLLQGMGRMGDNAKAMLVTIAINAALDPLLLYGYGFVPGLGLPGIALSGILSRACGFLLLAGVYLRRQPLPETSSKGAGGKEVILDILKVAVPTSISRSSQPLSLVLLNSIMLAVGPCVVAARGLGARLDTLAHLPALAISPAVVALVGQHWGAGQRREALSAAHRSALLVATVMLGIGVLVVVRPSLIWNLVSPDPHLQEAGYGYLRFLGATYFLVGTDMVYSSGLQGLGLGYPALIITVVRVWIISLPVAYLLVTCLGWGAEGIWLALAMGNVWSGVAAALWFVRTSRTQHHGEEVIHQNALDNIDKE